MIKIEKNNKAMEVCIKGNAKDTLSEYGFIGNVLVNALMKSEVVKTREEAKKEVLRTVELFIDKDPRDEQDLKDLENEKKKETLFKLMEALYKK